jgi:signal transduction histidine kinase
VQQARATQLQGAFPAEVQPLVDDFNAVLARNAEVVERARTQAGNLAHALKTPLSVLENAARAPAPGDGTTLAALVRDQVQVARRHMDWHLARARVAASAHLPGQRTAVAPVADGLVRVMNKVHAGRDVGIEVVLPDAPLFFAGEAQDLQEMLGNLLDNACKWARSTVRLQARADGHSGSPRQILLWVEDDGPGIEVVRRAGALQRGVRLDETVPGTGLGLAIVQDLALMYGGQLSLEAAELGGLRAVLALPQAV